MKIRQLFGSFILYVIALYLCVFAILSCSPNANRTFDQFESFTLKRDTQEIEVPRDLPEGEWKGLLVVKFDSECHLCRDKTDAMLRESAMLNDFMIVLASSEDWIKIKSFEREFGLSDQHNYVVGQTDEESFHQRFNAVVAPFTVVCNHRGEEVYRFDGNPSLHPILNAYFEIEQ